MWNLIPWNKSRGERGGELMTSDPFEREFQRMRDDFQSLLSRVWHDSPFGERAAERFGQWGSEVEETDTHYVVHVAAPGFEIGEFDVKVSGNRLTLSAEHKEEGENGKNGGRFHRFGKLSHSFELPEGAKAEEIQAQYRNGVLELQIPKGRAAENVKKIEVKGA